ncbi:lipase 3 isoform X2 [Drosophila grimshawi]|nr:lipase 3 isoform X2 [Drosophila grimshawi]
MPAMIDYALDTNGQGQKSIHYVGHSQGTTVFFTLMSSRPEYNEKIKTAHMFAPVAIMAHMQNKLVRAVAPCLGHVNQWSHLFSSREFLPFNSFLLTFISFLWEPLPRIICVHFLKKFFDTGRWNLSALAEGFGEQPAGCSTNQILHYMQEQQSGHFRLYDYGTRKNLEMYKSEQPPDYPVENITAIVHLWYSKNDVMAAVEDVLALANRLPNKVLHQIKDPRWEHDDFALNLEIRDYVNKPVVEIIQNFERIKNEI